MSSAIEGLEPKKIWEYFAELSTIPRGSKNEAKAAAYIVGVAKKLGLEVQKDTAGNVVVRKPAGAGRENAPMVALQGHLDMVCEKNKDKVHNFEKDPIVLRRNGNFLTADGTTLGADNGIGVCTALALMEEQSVLHGPLEFLFTIDEETGLTGANNLKDDFVKSRTLLNLDSEEEGILYVGCSGGGDTVGTLHVEFEAMPAQSIAMNLKIGGLRGGHSGLEINTGRGNAIKLINRVLYILTEMGVRLASIEGGNKRNAIPRETETVIVVPKKLVDEVKKVVASCDALFKTEYATVDGGVALSVTEIKGKRVRVLKKARQKKLVILLYALPHGVIAMSPDIPGLVETSTNLATINTTRKGIIIATSQRSSVESEKEDVVQMVHSTFVLSGAEVEHGDGYPGWKPNLNSAILKIAKDTYQKKYGRLPEVKAIHAGLECGIIGEKFPGMDMISFGPTLEMVHSPEERVHIDTVKTFWDYLCAILDRVSS
ncbi:MAG: aminoacyl-histidine dipeptidase [Bacteroidota bacterium]